MLPSFKIRYGLLMCLFGLCLGLTISESYLIGFLLFTILILLLTKKTSQCLLLIAFSISILYSFQYQKKIKSEKIEITKKLVSIEAQAINYAKISGISQTQHLKVISIDQFPRTGKLLLKHKQFIEVDPKSIITFTGQIKPIKNYSDFNYALYLSQFGISGLITPSSKIEIKKTSTSFIHKIGPALRKKAQKNIESKINPPHSLIALGMTIGINEKLPKITESQIKNSGLQHLIVVSGSNITLLVCLIVLIFRNFGPYLVSLITIVSITIFWLTVGPEPPVNRAVIFGFCSSLSLLFGKKADARNLVLLAALIMSLINPLLLGVSLSFWLSFTATLGIVCLVPILYSFFKTRISNEKINLTLSLILSAQLSVFTIIIHHFDKFPASGIITNLIVEPLVPIIMISTSALGLLSLIPILGDLFGFITFHLVNLVLLVAKILSPLPQISLPSFILYLFYGLQGFLLIYCLFSKHYQTRFYEPFHAKLDLSSKPKKI